MQTRRLLFIIISFSILMGMSASLVVPVRADQTEGGGSGWHLVLTPTSSGSQGCVFNGRLSFNGQPVTGSFDFTFQIFDTPAGGAPTAELIHADGLWLTDGAFTLELPGSCLQLTSGQYWLEVGLHQADESFTMLGSRLALDGSAKPASPQAPSASSQENQTPLSEAATPDEPLFPGDFTLKASSPVALTCVTTDPTTGLVYAQANMGTAFYVYDPASDAWSSLAASPLFSWNNGGAAYLGGKIYTVYTGDFTNIGVYDIATNSWSTIPNGLGLGTGVITTDGSALYLAVGTAFMAYYPGYGWYSLPAPSIDIQPWGGMAYWNGFIYAHRGNGYTEFAKYDMGSGVWSTLTPLPAGAVLGSAIDPIQMRYYTYGTYGGTNLYYFDLNYEVWSTLTIPFFSVEDGGLVYVAQPGYYGIYFVQGEGGTGFARLETMPEQVNDFQIRATSPGRLTCVAADPTTGLIYAQQDMGTAFYVYDPLRNVWSYLSDAPLNSGNNGGAAYLDGKIYTVYTGNATDIGVYDIASNTWGTIPNGLGAGSGVISSDGTYLYLAVTSYLLRYNPSTSGWTTLATPSIDIQPWGGMAYWNGKLYVHQGNSGYLFAKYDILTDTWTTLPDLPGGAVLGSAIDPVRQKYYAYGSYFDDNWYIFDLVSETWNWENIHFFTVLDGGMAYAKRGRVSGVYFVQGEGGLGFARYQDASPSSGGFTINGGNMYTNNPAVTLNILAVDPETGVEQMRFRNETLWRALLFQDVYPWGSDAQQQILEGNSLPYDQLPSSAMASTDFSPYSQVIIPSDQPQAFYDTYNATRTKFEDYASNGGLVEFHAAAWGWYAGNLTDIPLPGNMNVKESPQNYNYISEPSHPLAAFLPNPIYGSYASHGYFVNLPAGSLTISTEGTVPGGQPTLVEYPLGAGRVVASGQTLEISWDYAWDSWRLLENMIPYLAEHQPWSLSTPWTLEPGDGVKTVVGQFVNGGGVWSGVYTSTITLDTQPPSSSATCPAKTGNLSFTVSWSGSDSLSGLSSFDVQYKVGAAGVWTAWPEMTGTAHTSEVFGPDYPADVERGQTYYFRVRARDKAGNVEIYPTVADCSTYVELIELYLPMVIRN